MGLDFRWNRPGETEELLVSLDAQVIDLLDPAFSHLYARTGVMVDPYGTTRISPEHAELLADVILELISSSGPSKMPRQLTNLIGILRACSRERRWLRAEGD